MTRPAGCGAQTGERAKLKMGHEVVWKSVQNECMELADGAAKLRDLALEQEQRRVSKRNLTKTSWSYGKNGSQTRYEISARMPDIRGDYRSESVFDNKTIKPRPYLWDYDRGCSQTTTMRACMDGGIEAKGENIGQQNFAVDPKELKAKLTTTTYKAGDGLFHGFTKRMTNSHEGAELAENRASAARKGPLVRQESIENTLFPSERREYRTSTHDTMRADLYLDRQLMRSRNAGFRKQPTENDGGIQLEMPSCFAPYLGGRSPVQ